MKIQIQKKMFEMFPEYKEGILIIKGFKQEENSDASYQFLDTTTQKVRMTTNIESDVENNIWTTTFKEIFDKSGKVQPSHIALLNKVLDTNDLPNINTITNVINAIQLKNMLPIGAHDLKPIEGDVTVGLNENNKQFLPRDNNESEEVETNEIVHMDDVNVLTRRWCWRQGRKDLCTQDTTDFIIFLNSLNEKDNLNEIVEEILSTLKRFSNSEFTAQFEILSEKNNSLVVEDIKEVKVPKPINFTYFPIRKDIDVIERILNKGVEDILPKREHLKELLLSGRRLKVYQGFDPTAPTLHIGHTVTMRKLEEFRKLGHEVYMLIGDFTGRIGDPTDKTSARVTLTESQVLENLKLYKQQASKLLNMDDSYNPVKVVFNNDWLGKLKFADILDIASEFTVQQMIKRDMFQRRLEEDKPIYLHEFLYPLMQGWDSVALDVDVELGGNDQMFNMLAGRTLVQKRLRKDKTVVTGKLLTTSEGKKMGKSEGNMIMLSDSPENIFGKVMAFTDEQIVQGFELLTNLGLDEVEDIERKIQTGSNPMEFKKKLAWTIVSELKSKEEADTASTYFENIYQKGNLNVDIETISLHQESMKLIDLIVESGMSSSKSEARRLVDQGAVYINDQKKSDFQEEILIQNIVLKVGRRVVKIVK